MSSFLVWVGLVAVALAVYFTGDRIGRGVVIGARYAGAQIAQAIREAKR